MASVTLNIDDSIGASPFFNPLQSSGASCQATSCACSNLSDNTSRMQPEFDPYCVGVVYMGPSTKKKITKPPEPLPFTRTATRACSIIYSPRVDLSREFDLYSDNDGSAATMVMVRLVLCTVRFFYTLWVPLVRRTGMHIHHLNSVRVRLWLVGVDMMG